MKCRDVCFLCTELNPTSSQTVGVTSAPQTEGAITTTRTVPISSSIQPTINGVITITETALASSSIHPTKSERMITTTATVPVSSSIQFTINDGITAKTETALAISSIHPTKSEGMITTTGTVLVSSSIQQLTDLPSDGTTTTLVIIVVAVVIILVVIVVGVVILVVLIRTKKRKQQLVINKLLTATTENEMKLKHEVEVEGAIEKEATPSTDQPPYAEIQTVAPPNVPSKSEDLVNLNTPLTVGYSEIELEPDDSKQTLPAKPPRNVTPSDLTPKSTEPNPIYQNMNQHHDTLSPTGISQGNDIYTVPDTTSSHTVERDSSLYETVYNEPIQPSLFIDAVETPSDCEDLHPYAPVYTVPMNLPMSKEMALIVFGSNIREIHELGMGHFGKVILAETVGLSAKDLRLSESDDDKSKSTLVAVKKLKSDASTATKEAFEKEVNFMSRLTDRNVIRILGVCYEDTPFIMMEYMEKGDLNQYLQKFKIHSTTDSEPQGLITTTTLVHMATQIASAMKYLASHNFVHRDLATRNCLVGPKYLVKISDFGMSRSLYDSHYYRIHGRFALPVRWMSFECFYGKFSQKSDVWAFGVTMWEIFALAKEQPYNDMSDKQVVEDALRGKNRKILSKPDMCPFEVYKIMLECWAHNSEQRATFEELLQLLTSVYHNV